MSKFTGNIIRLPAVTPTQNSASGVYTLDDQFTAQSSGTWPIVRDQYFNYTTLLLTGAVQGTAYPNPVTQPYSFLSDASTNNFVVSPNGDVSARPFNPYLNNYSNSFDGASGTYLSIANSSVLDQSGDFTQEAWYCRTGDGFGTVDVIYIKNITNFAYIGVTQSTGIVTVNQHNVGALITGTTATVAGIWYHLAVTRSSNSLRLFVNGVQEGGTVTYSTNTTGSATSYIGGFPAAHTLLGYLSNLRVTNTAVYTSNFTPPTQPLQNISGTSLLTCQSNRFRDVSSNGFTITPNGSPAVSQNSPFVSYDTTNGSGYFDGTGDYLAVLDNAALDMGSSDFTIEGWVYLTSSGASQTFIAKGTGADSQASYHIVFNGTNWLYYLSGNGSTWSIASGVSMGAGVVNAWQHLALVRNGNTFTPYINGTAGTTTNSATAVFDSNKIFSIGADDPGNQRITGYISNVRVVKGTAIVPPAGGPTAPLQAVTNTSLLTLQTRAPATNNGFIDSSPNNFVVTRNGNTTQGSFSPFSPTGWSNYFDGTDDSLTGPSGSPLQLGTGDFSIEAFVFGPTQKAYAGILGGASTPSGWTLRLDNTGTLRLTNGTVTYSSTSTVATNTWTHIAVTRQGTTLRFFINGTQYGSPTASDSIDLTGGGFQVGKGFSVDGSNGCFTGNISNIRIIKSQAIYTGSFTSPSAALTSSSVGTSGTNVASSITGTVSLLTCQSNRFIDNSPNNFAITANNGPSVQAFSPFAPAQSYIPSQIGGSGYFDGTTDYLSSASNALLSPGSGDFTIEAWIYPTTSYSTYNAIYTAGSTTNGMFFGKITGGIGIRAVNTGDIISATAPSINQWVHVAVSRSGTSMRIFFNGVQQGSTVTDSTNFATSAIYVGDDGAGTASWNGYISNLRFVKGTAVYTSNFTPPTAPPTAIPNTSLLLNFTNGGIVDATGKNNLETVANSGVQTKVFKFGNGSSYFDGTTDKLVLPNIPMYDLGSGAFTLEFWVYWNATPTALTEYRVWWTTNRSTGVTRLDMGFYNGEVFAGYAGTNILGSPSLSWTASQWYHIALVRSGNAWAIFRDGTRVANNASNSTTLVASTFKEIGENMNCFLDDFRLTTGIARYDPTLTSVPIPTGPFPLG